MATLTPEQASQLVTQAAIRYDIDPKLAFAVAKKESGNFNPDVINARILSYKGAVGTMQMTPIAAKDVGYSWRDMFDPIKNIYAGIIYLKKQLERFNYNIPVAIAAYNAGPTYMAEIIANYGWDMANWINKVWDETRKYVPAVLNYYASAISDPMFISFFTGKETFPGQKGISDILGSLWDWITGKKTKEAQPPISPASSVKIVKRYPTEDIVATAIIGISAIFLLNYLFGEK